MNSLRITLLNNKLSIIKNVTLCVCVALIMCISSMIYVPFYPIPFTLQTLALTFIGIFFDKRIAFSGILMFCLFRLNILTVGLSSISTCLSFGYLLAFCVTPFIISRCNKQNVISMITHILCAKTLVLLCGTLWLALFLDITTAVKTGFLFFIPADLLKTFIEIAFIKIFCKKS